MANPIEEREKKKFFMLVQYWTRRKNRFMVKPELGNMKKQLAA